MSDEDSIEFVDDGPSGIASLVALAQDTSESGRKALGENITDLFLSEENRLSDHERALMLDILGKLIRTVEADIRRQLSDKLADTDWAPRELVTALANDTIEIARPILERSTVLQDADLIEVIRSRAREHRLTIAISRELSEEVSDAIVEVGAGEDDVLEALIGNENASLSRAAMDYLVAESERRDGFQEPLLRREDLPPELAYKMFWWVGAALRDFIINDFEIEPHILGPILEEATAAGLENLGGAAQKSAQAAAARLSEEMGRTEHLNISVLLNLLERGRIQAFMAGLSQLSGVSFDTVNRIVLDQGGEALALICRAIEADRNQFTRMALLVKKVNAVGPMRVDAVEQLARLFDEVDAEKAAIALYYWQKDSPLQNAVEELRRKKRSH